MIQDREKPAPGQSVITTSEHPFFNPGAEVGKVLKVDGNICLFTNSAGDTDRFIWNFPRTGEKNRFYDWV